MSNNDSSTKRSNDRQTGEVEAVTAGVETMADPGEDVTLTVKWLPAPEGDLVDVHFSSTFSSGRFLMEPERAESLVDGLTAAIEEATE